MSPNPYEKFRGQKLTLNDYLALDRTELANERTLLAYGRTAIALIITGGSAIKFFDAWWVMAAGAVFIVAGAIAAAIGWRRYRSMTVRLSAALDDVAADNKESEPPKSTG